MLFGAEMGGVPYDLGQRLIVTNVSWQTWAKSAVECWLAFTICFAKRLKGHFSTVSRDESNRFVKLTE